MWNCTHFRHPTDEQLGHVGIFFSNYMYFNLQSVYFEFREKPCLLVYSWCGLSLFGRFSAFSSSFRSVVVLSAMTRIVVSLCQESVVLIIWEPLLRQTLQYKMQIYFTLSNKNIPLWNGIKILQRRTKKKLILVAELQLRQQCMHKKPHKLSILLFFDSLFRVRYVCLRGDYNFDKTMFAPLEETEVKKAFRCFNVSFVRLISLTFRTIWLMVSVSIAFRSTK